MAIVISKQGSDSAEVVDKSDFALERNLQDYICKHPEAISVGEKRLLVVARELQTNSGPIDAFAVDREGELYLVETKLYRNPDKRTVVAQMLDYGASLWRNTEFEQLHSALNRAALDNWKLPFREKAGKFFSLGDDDLDRLIETMRQNLVDGNLKFVVLMDKLDERLKDLIAYVNENSDFAIYAVEIEFYKHQEYEIVIPKLYGAEIPKNPNSRPSRGDLWTWERFREKLQRFGDNSDVAAEQILQWAGENGIKIDWSRSQRGGCILCFYNDQGKGFYPFNVNGDGKIGWNAPHQEDKAPVPFDTTQNRVEILRRLQAIPGVMVDLSNVDGYRGHNLPLSVFADEKARAAFFDVCSWIRESLVKGQL